VVLVLQIKVLMVVFKAVVMVVGQVQVEVVLDK
jgi:hypothetical protein